MSLDSMDRADETQNDRASGDRYESVRGSSERSARESRDISALRRALGQPLAKGGIAARETVAPEPAGNPAEEQPTRPVPEAFVEAPEPSGPALAPAPHVSHRLDVGPAALPREARERKSPRGLRWIGAVIAPPVVLGVGLFVLDRPVPAVPPEIFASAADLPSLQAESAPVPPDFQPTSAPLRVVAELPAPLIPEAEEPPTHPLHASAIGIARSSLALPALQGMGTAELPVLDPPPRRVATVPGAAPRLFEPGLTTDEADPVAASVLPPQPSPSPVSEADVEWQGAAGSQLSDAATVEEARTADPVSQSEPAASGPAEPRVVVHYMSAVGREDAEATIAALRVSGFSNIEARAVPFGISVSNVRYYFESDLDAARRSVSALGWDRTPAVLRDFSFYDPLPSRGTIEIWVGQ
ncbi:hypothetical protein [Amaricoccus macauensis]|uniref:hypothetical protein n=1 Tax=Amaricoccus macauensis TaxID=57001 RepID=UPI003C7CA715